MVFPQQAATEEPREGASCLQSGMTFTKDGGQAERVPFSRLTHRVASNPVPIFLDTQPLRSKSRLPSRRVVSAPAGGTRIQGEKRRGCPGGVLRHQQSDALASRIQ